MGSACCSNTNGDGEYDYDMKTKKISQKNQETLLKYSEGAAARRYTQNLKFEMIREIT